MFDYEAVIWISGHLGFTELSELTIDEYKDLLMNFGEYMRNFNIKQK
jgi:hypothetical protein